MTVGQALKKCPLFARLNDRQVRKLLPLCSSLTVEPNTVICKQGDPAEFLYVVESGRVALELSVPSPEGAHTRPGVVATEGPGGAFGWSAIVEPHTMTLTARAMDLGESCRIVRIDGKALRELLQADRRMGYDVMSGIAELLAHRLMQTRETLMYERGWADVV